MVAFLDLYPPVRFIAIRENCLCTLYIRVEPVRQTVHLSLTRLLLSPLAHISLFGAFHLSICGKTYVFIVSSSGVSLMFELSMRELF